MPATLLNHDDSRVLRVSIGALGRTAPRMADLSRAVSNGAQCPCASCMAGLKQAGDMQKLYCLSCGKEGTAITAGMPPALRGQPGVQWTCNDCDDRFGRR